MACEYCDIAQGKLGELVFDNGNVVAFMPPNAYTLGHIVLMPKKHFSIMEQIPDELLQELFVVGNKLSLVLIDALGIQGVNMIVDNGLTAGQKIAHFSVNLIPRKEGDNLNFTWQPKQMGEEQLSSVEQKVKEVLEKQKEQVPEPVVDASPSQSSEPDLDDEENYLVRSLDRIP